MEKMQEMFTKYLEELKNKQMNNTLEGINSRITEAEKWISYLEDRMVEINAAKQNIKLPYDPAIPLLGIYPKKAIF